MNLSVIDENDQFEIPYVFEVNLYPNDWKKVRYGPFIEFLVKKSRKTPLNLEIIYTSLSRNLKILIFQTWLQSEHLQNTME